MLTFKYFICFGQHGP